MTKGCAGDEGGPPEDVQFAAVAPSFLHRVAFLALLFAASCDQSFEPVRTGEPGFSLYGFLDAAADTQWIRVTAVRDLLATSDAPLDGVVWIEEVASGRTFPLRDSLFVYPANNLDFGENRFAHNFWTTERLQADAEYRVVAEQSDGFRSTATVRIPPPIESVAVEYSLRSPLGPATVTFSGGPYVGMVLVHHFGCGSVGPRIVYQDLPSPPLDGDHRVRVLLNDPAGDTCLGDKRIRVVSSGAPWAFDPEWDGATALLPDAGSNVENGVGFVGGVVTASVPVELCTSRGTAGANDICTLRYDDRSAILEGRIWETTCGERELSGVAVSLTEVDRDRVRSPRRGGGPTFRLEGLEPDVPYRLTLGLAGFTSFDEFILFEPGETRSVDIALRRNAPSVEC